MSRVFWDSMLFIYLLDGEPGYSERAQYLLERSMERGDTLYTSYVVLGEVLVGAARSGDPNKPRQVRRQLDSLGFSYLPFDENAVFAFCQLRARPGVQVADAIHLACAASAGIDLFLTNDRQLTKLHVPGIQFIAEFNTPLL